MGTCEGCVYLHKPQDVYSILLCVMFDVFTTLCTREPSQGPTYERSELRRVVLTSPLLLEADLKPYFSVRFKVVLQ